MPQHMLPDAEARRSLHRAQARSSSTCDWQEVVTFSFVDVGDWERAISPATPSPIRVLNPIAAQLDVMRTTLLPAA